MIKKHLITCTVLLGMLLIAKMLIFSAPVNPIQAVKFNEPRINNTQNEDAAPQILTFANENIPVNDARVNWRLNRMLKAHEYEQLQTSVLHRKAAKFFPLIEPILKMYGIPEDFKYVPLVESGLQSGTSPKGASGMWQFMPQTARDFGLRVDGNVDERQMVIKSTVAACKYLKSLFGEFNSWTLAAAAYNIGEGNLKRAMSRQNQDNYFKIKLNRETATYVYKLVSMKEIIENPKKYGYHSRSSKLMAKVQVKEKDNFSHFKPVNERLGLTAFNTYQN